MASDLKKPPSNSQEGKSGAEVLRAENLKNVYVFSVEQGLSLF